MLNIFQNQSDKEYIQFADLDKDEQDRIYKEVENKITTNLANFINLPSLFVEPEQNGLKQLLPIINIAATILFGILIIIFK